MAPGKPRIINGRDTSRFYIVNEEQVAVRLVILGGPGAGKGTQAKLLCDYLKIPHISSGEILRAEIEAETALGEQVQPYVERGDFVPDRTMIELIRQRLQLPDVTNGWLLDGYPRTAFQAEELDFLLDDLNQRLNWAIWLEVPKDVLMERSLQRSRQDDSPEVVQRRINLIYERTVPILDYYEYRDRLLRIKGEQSIENVQTELRRSLQIS